jgi:6,7-dimethyl-8-ribityllumazine synthase
LVVRKNKVIMADTQIAIVWSQFNEEIVVRLLDGAKSYLANHGVSPDSIQIVQVPGAFELPFMAKKLALTERFVAVICLGAVIRGDTDHYDFVCDAAARGILEVGLETGIPVIFGVLTCDNDVQALDRAGGSHGNKGADAAQAALSMIETLRRINS